MIQVISKYLIGKSTYVRARVNGKVISLSLTELQSKARKFKQAMAPTDARNILDRITP